MEDYYRFLSDKEPSDEQLHQLMLEVATESKKKAVASNDLFWKQIQKMIEQNAQNSENKVDRIFNEN
jgi:hypothetical protein